jgi:hypothetical protein
MADFTHRMLLKTGEIGRFDHLVPIRGPAGQREGRLQPHCHPPSGFFAGRTKDGSLRSTIVSLALHRFGHWP